MWEEAAASDAPPHSLGRIEGAMMAKKSLFVVLAILGALSLWPRTALAIPLTATLDNVSFGDGYTASGSFQYNSSSGVITNSDVELTTLLGPTIALDDTKDSFVLGGNNGQTVVELFGNPLEENEIQLVLPGLATSPGTYPIDPDLTIGGVSLPYSVDRTLSGGSLVNPGGSVVVTASSSTPCASILQNNPIQPEVFGPIITAEFSPANSNVTLSQAETACKVMYFDWQQTITTIPEPTQSQLTSNGKLVSSGTGDPPQDGWDYQKSRKCPNTFPFYYTPSQPAGTCLSLFSHINGNSLNFFDDPGDPCLPLTGKPTATQQANHKLAIDMYCGGKDADGSAELFTTTLVGVEDGALVKLPITESFLWGTTWNGTTGGTFQQNTDDLFDPGSGTGGAFLISVDGVAVPEPESIILLVLSAACTVYVGRRTRTTNHR
jgi:hypothetical protein